MIILEVSAAFVVVWLSLGGFLGLLSSGVVAGILMEEGRLFISNPLRFAYLFCKAEWPSQRVTYFDVLSILPLWSIHWLPLFRIVRARCRSCR